MIKAYRRTSFRYDFIRENHEKEINFSFKFVSQEGKDKKKPHFKGLNLHFEFFIMNDKKIGIIAKTSVGDINIIRVLHLLIFASLSTDIIGCKFFILNIIFFLLFFGYDSKCIYSCTILKGKTEISTAPNAEKNKPISLI